MANLLLRGSSTADATFTTGNDMSLNATGGTETSKTTTTIGANNFAEVLSQGGTASSVASIPAVPTKNGFFYKPGAGNFAAGNFGCTANLSSSGGGTNVTHRAFKYDGVSTFTQLGSVVSSSAPTAKTAISFPSMSVSAFSTLSTDWLYFDFWWQDTAGAAADNPVIYESTSATQGVASDVEITTTSFTPSGSTKQRISDGYGGLFE